jgi:hypothetical protein
MRFDKKPKLISIVPTTEINVAQVLESNVRPRIHALKLGGQSRGAPARIMT